LSIYVSDVLRFSTLWDNLLIVRSQSFLGLDRERAPLKITQRMLCRILTYHQVAPDYLNFLYIFGKQSRAQDLRYSGFRSHASLTVARPGMAIPDLGRSGSCFELCYNLKTVVCKNPSADHLQRTWAIRQGAVYHQFDVLNGKALWLMTTAEGHHLLGTPEPAE
jgi:hypothetical protein